jgi:hypothetical protein
MSLVTEAGRKRVRDIRRERVERELRGHSWFTEAPRLLVSGLADLMVVSRELRALMLTEGLKRPDGETLHPAVEALRAYKHTELCYLKTMVELCAAQPSQSQDLVAAMAAEPEAETVEPAGDPEQSGEGED